MALRGKNPLVSWLTKLYLVASRQLPQSCEGSPKRTAKWIQKMPQNSDTNTTKSTRFSYPVGSSLQESQALLSSLHHSPLHFSRNQVNRLNGRHLPFVSLKQGSARWALFCMAYYTCTSLMRISAANPVRVRLKADFCITRTTIKFSVMKCTRPMDWDLTVAYVLPAKAKTSVSARQTCCENRRHVNYLTKILASKSAFL